MVFEILVRRVPDADKQGLLRSGLARNWHCDDERELQRMSEVNGVNTSLGKPWTVVVGESEDDARDSDDQAIM